MNIQVMMLSVMSLFASVLLADTPKVTVREGNGIERELKVENCRCSAMPVNIRWPGHQRELDQTEICSFARFDLSDPVEVCIDAGRPFRTATLRPRCKGVKVRQEGNRLSFTLKERGGYSVELDGTHENLMLIADVPADYSDIDKKSAHVRYYGPGEHEAGLITLVSGETLFIDEGAVVYGRVFARDADHVRVCGRGILDMSRIQGDPISLTPEKEAELRKKGWAITNIKRYDAMRFDFCDDLRIEGITIRDSLIYAIRPIGCHGLTVENVKILGSWRYNSDGIDMHNCRDVLVRNCFIRTFDDSICVKGFDYILPESEMLHDGVLHDVFENVLVEKCTIWNDWGRALEIGAETRAREIRNVTFRDCDVLACQGVVADVQNCDQADVHDVSYENIRVDWPSFVQQSVYAEHASSFNPSQRGLPAALVGAYIHYVPEYSKAGAQNRGRVRNICFRDFSVVGADELPRGEFMGFDSDHRIDNVTLSNIVLNGKDVTEDLASAVCRNDFADVPKVEVGVGRNNPVDLPVRFPVATKLSKEYSANTVPSEGQIRSRGFVRFEGEGRDGGLLVIGSSYAWHEPKPEELGWSGDWGMAASAREKDAVHLLWNAVKRENPAAPLCIAQSANWERNYTGDVELLERDFAGVKAFRPDWICVITTVGNAQPEFAERHPIDRHYETMVEWFRQLNPKAKVVLSVTDRIPEIGAAVRCYGKKRGFPVVDLGFLNEPGSGYRAQGLYRHQGVAWHPSDLGMAEMAARYTRALIVRAAD